jgi:prefoldin subunit 5
MTNGEVGQLSEMVELLRRRVTELRRELELEAYARRVAADPVVLERADALRKAVANGEPIPALSVGEGIASLYRSPSELDIIEAKIEELTLRAEEFAERLGQLRVRAQELRDQAALAPPKASD